MVIFEFKQKKLEKVYLRFKGYLRYKNINSQNMPYEAQVKNFFV